jgi:hypothetical protein
MRSIFGDRASLTGASSWLVGGGNRDDAHPLRRDRAVPQLPIIGVGEFPRSAFARGLNSAAQFRYETGRFAVDRSSPEMVGHDCRLVNGDQDVVGLGRPFANEFKSVPERGKAWQVSGIRSSVAPFNYVGGGARIPRTIGPG